MPRDYSLSTREYKRMDNTTTLEQLKKTVVSFRDERNWRKFHDPKNLSMALSVEASELQELFLWKSEVEIETLLSTRTGRQRLEEEMADVMIFLLYLSERCNVDLSAAVAQKLEINRRKYPVDRSYDNTKKYTELGTE